MGQKKPVSRVLEKLSEQDLKIVKDFLIENHQAVSFGVLNLFEESDFKIVYEQDGKQYDLRELADRLEDCVPFGSVIHTEHGWIARYSEYADQVSDDLLPRSKDK